MNLNRVILVGRISNDVRYFQTSTGVPYARFTIAITRRGNTQNENTDFVPVIAWRTQAEFVSRYLGKGDLISIEGTIQSSQYTDKNNVLVRAVDVAVDTINPLESREMRMARRSRQQGGNSLGASFRDQNSYTPRFRNNNWNNQTAQQDENPEMPEMVNSYQNVPDFSFRQPTSSHNNVEIKNDDDVDAVDDLFETETQLANFAKKTGNFSLPKIDADTDDETNNKTRKNRFDDLFSDEEEF
ncbi:single-stranded DNA-binding protein [Mycoplasmopsis columbinasalis]|uniref:Single-stranded DNA-binding protein n=1 Tax=Mycoplasmopsis columbinasalis TaxID=114880 RepID=A0A449B9F2_9BACT|nr:single-stranded DNA-binding protein [Mycoplasmopsis columbinasalis]VEU77796.1 single strand binding protein [Mycoplasmopsis columbinasalis]